MTDTLDSIIINGYVGKELTLSFLNKMLISKGYNVLYLKISKSGCIQNIYVNDELINYSMVIDGEFIFDELDIVRDIYKKYRCNIILTKSSRYNSELNPLIYGITKYNTLEINTLTDNKFLSHMVPTMSVIQGSEIMKKIINACGVAKAPLVVSEHHHFSYIKYDTGLDIDYSYQSFVLALNISKLLNYIFIGDISNIPYNKATLYGYSVLKLVLGKDIPSKIILNNPYYINKFKKDNITFYCDTLKTSFVADDVIKWFCKNISQNDINLCIFNTEPSTELIKIVDSMSRVKFETIYIADYSEIGYSYDNLVYFDKYGTLPTVFNDWSETIYKSFACKPHQGIVVDNISSILDWISKYSGIHSDKKFNVLCIGSKKLIDSIVLKI